MRARVTKIHSNDSNTFSICTLS